MDKVEYDLDTSGGLMQEIQNLIAPPQSDESKRRQAVKDASNIYRRPAKTANHDTCDACKEDGDLLCCDLCPSSFHLQCCDPPLEDEDVPTGEWICNECKYGITKKCDLKIFLNNSSIVDKSNERCLSSQSSSPIECEAGLNPFEKLTSFCRNKNPTEFQLPTNMQDFTVMPGDRKRRTPLQAKKKDEEAQRHCFICTKSSRIGNLINCDFCPLVFHCDCLMPPLAQEPIGLWMCPNHPENFEPYIRTPKYSERAQVMEDLRSKVNHNAVKLQFFKRAKKERILMNRKFHKPKVRRVSVVPDIVKAQYRNPPAVVIPDMSFSNIHIQPHMKPFILPTPDEKEQWLKAVIDLHCSIATDLEKVKTSSSEVNVIKSEATVSSVLPIPSSTSSFTICSQVAPSSTSDLSCSTSSISSSPLPTSSVTHSPTLPSLHTTSTLNSSSVVSVVTACSAIAATSLTSAIAVTSLSSAIAATSLTTAIAVTSLSSAIAATSLTTAIAVTMLSPSIVVTTLSSAIDATALTSPSSISSTSTSPVLLTDTAVTTTPVQHDAEMLDMSLNDSDVVSSSQGVKEDVASISMEADSTSTSCTLTASEDSMDSQPSSLWEDECESIETPAVSSNVVIVANRSIVSNSMPAVMSLSPPSFVLPTISSRMREKLSSSTTTSNHMVSSISSEILKDPTLSQLDDRLIRILAFQRLQQLVDKKNQSIPKINKPGITEAKSYLQVTETKNVIAVLSPLNGIASTCYMRYKSFNAGQGADMDLCFSSYGYCNYVSAKHATIFYDKESDQFELLNYSEHGTIVDNVLYSCDFSEKAKSNITSGNARYDSHWKYMDPAERKRKPPVGRTTRGLGTEFITKKCNCRASASSLIGGSGAGWEGTAILHHGSYVKFGCLHFVFSIVNCATTSSPERCEQVPIKPDHPSKYGKIKTEVA